MTPFGYIMTTYFTVLAIELSAFLHPAPKIIWNASASVPIGFYAVRATGVLQVNELVVVRPPEPLASFLADRGYLPRGVSLLKGIAALPGQTVCRVGRTITVDSMPIGDALEFDRRGRALPVWQGCSAIAPGEVFVMNPQSEDSLDGRYFGPLPAAAVEGRAEPLWTQDKE